MSLKRMNAIFIKELQDAKTNWNQLFMYVIPIAITFLYAKILPPEQMPKGMALSIGLLMLVIMAGVFIPAMMVAEEKEKRTLEALILSPAKPAEIFFSKSLVTFITIIVCMFILLFIDNKNWGTLPIIIIATSLISIFCILFGLAVGIFSKNQMATSIVGTPVMFLFLLPPMFAVMGIKEMEPVAKVVPTYYYMDLLKKVTFEGIRIEQTLYSLAILAISIVVELIILFVVYKKKGLE